MAKRNRRVRVASTNAIATSQTRARSKVFAFPDNIEFSYLANEHTTDRSGNEAERSWPDGIDARTPNRPAAGRIRAPTARVTKRSEVGPTAMM
jgi:hypothetical protein